MKSRRNPSRFYGRVHNSWDQSAACNSQKVLLQPVKNRERKGPSQGVTQHSDPHERSPCAPTFEDRSEKQTLKQERCARRVAWKMAKSIHKLKGQSHILLTFRGCVFTSAICKETRGKRLCGRLRSINAHAEKKTI